MSTVTNLPSIDSTRSVRSNSATAQSAGQQILLASETSTVATGTIAFRDHLSANVAATSASKPAGNVQSSTTPNAPSNTSTAVPLSDRLYGGPPLPPASGMLGITGTATGMGTSVGSTTNPNILSFAEAIRKPASIAALELGTSTNTVIAFAGLETGWGQHIPATHNNTSNNLFGIKTHNTGRPSITNATTEYIDGEAQTLDQQFRRYRSVDESIADFSHFIRSNPRYEEALSHANNPEQFIKKVHEAGYATDPNYADKVIDALQQLDNITTKTGAIGIGWK